MPKYEPIDVGVQFDGSASDLIGFEWRKLGIFADFILPEDSSKALRVSFDSPCIVRLLDEMALSTEGDDTPDEGLISEHFAYRMQGARFARIQSDAWKSISGPITHYRFVTFWACMDVLSFSSPSFSIVARSDRATAKGQDPDGDSA